MNIAATIISLDSTATTTNDFALEVLDKNGCLIEGVHHLLGNPLSSLIPKISSRLGTRSSIFSCPFAASWVGPWAQGITVTTLLRPDDVGGRKMRRDGYDGYSYTGGKSSLSAPMGKPISVLDGVPVAIKDEIDCLIQQKVVGSASLVSVRLCPIAFGVDRGGSVRMPAALCGVVGLKPTFERIPHEGVLPLNWNVGMVGIQAVNKDRHLKHVLDRKLWTISIST
ncbi:Glutamyl-tRNA(Gln) amidotransferase subunit A [Glycine soja]